MSSDINEQELLPPAGPPPSSTEGILPEITPGPQPKADTTKSAVDPQVLERASGLGLTEEEIQSLGPEVVTGLVDRMEALAFERYQQQLRQSMPQQPQPPQNQEFPPPWGAPPSPPPAWSPPPPAPAWSQPPAQPPAQMPEFKIDLDPEIYDEGLVKTLKEMDQFYRNQVAQLNSALQMTSQSVNTWEAQQHADFSAWFDNHLTSGDESAVFGKGPIDRLQESSAEAKARLEVYQAYTDYLRFNGLPANSRDDELLSRVIRMKRGGPSEFQKQLSDQLKARAKGTIGKPSGTKRTTGDSERDPMTGLARSTVAEVQQMIDDMISRE